MKNGEKEKLICESAQRSAEHCNSMIWQVFAIGVALSLWILYKTFEFKENLKDMHFFILVFGFLVLFYSSLLIESLGQKKSLMYKIFNKKVRDNKFKAIERLTYKRVDWIAEIIIFSIFLVYLTAFGFVSLKHTYNGNFPYLIPIALIFSFILFIIVLFNWFLRPKDDGGNCLEGLRKCLLGKKLKTYEEIINYKK